MAARPSKAKEPIEIGRAWAGERAGRMVRAGPGRGQGGGGSGRGTQCWSPLPLYEKNLSGLEKHGIYIFLSLQQHGIIAL
jgi:hypothetical protein